MNRPPFKNQRSVGAEYERMAGRYLMSQGYEILEYNFRCRAGEIDLIARDREELVFCEVKYRTGGPGIDPLEAVDRKKQRTISQCAAYYLMKQDAMDAPCRFDVVGIRNDEIIHVKNAFDYAEI